MYTNPRETSHSSDRNEGVSDTSRGHNKSLSVSNSNARRKIIRQFYVDCSQLHRGCQCSVRTRNTTRFNSGRFNPVVAIDLLDDTTVLFVCLFVGCLTSQQHASVSQGQICSDNFTCSHPETEAADQTFYLTQSQYTDTGPTSPSPDAITPGAWQGSHRSANF